MKVEALVLVNLEEVKNDHQEGAKIGDLDVAKIEVQNEVGIKDPEEVRTGNQDKLSNKDRIEVMKNIQNVVQKNVQNVAKKDDSDVMIG